MTVHPKTAAVAAHAKSRIGATLDRLAGYLRIPAISCEPEHAGDVRALAEKIRGELEQLGFTGARLL